jgi:hypothetical protein
VIDPVTAVGLATSAFNAIKHGISVGRDIQDMTTQLSKWGQAFSDFNYAEEKSKNPPIWKSLATSKADNTAIEIFAHRKKMEEMRKEIKSHISLYYGPSAWEEVLRIEAEMRKQRKEEAYRKQEIKEAIVNWTVGILAFFCGATILFVLLYIVGKNQGKW